MNQILSEKDIIEITGYIQPKRQCKALTSKGIPFTTDRNGKPILTWTAFNSALFGEQPQADNSGFNLAAI